MTAPLDLDQLEALAAAASPGRWAVGVEHEGCGLEVITYPGDGRAETIGFVQSWDRREANAAFIAAAREAVPALVAEVRRLRAQEQVDDEEINSFADDNAALIKKLFLHKERAEAAEVALRQEKDSNDYYGREIYQDYAELLRRAEAAEVRVAELAIDLAKAKADAKLELDEVYGAAERLEAEVRRLQDRADDLERLCGDHLAGGDQ